MNNNKIIILETQRKLEKFFEKFKNSKISKISSNTVFLNKIGLLLMVSERLLGEILKCFNSYEFSKID